MRRVSLLLVCVAVAACRPRDATPVVPTDAAPPPTTKPLADTLVLAGPHRLLRAAFTPTGEVVVATPHELLRMATADAAPAEIVPFPEIMSSTRTARAGDVTVALGESGAVYVVQGHAVTKIGAADKYSALEISDDGRIVAAEDHDSHSLKMAVYDPTGRRITVVDRPSFLAPNGDWAAVPGHVVPVLAAGVAIDVAHGDPLGWLGTTAIFTGPRGIVLVDSATRSRQDFETCSAGQTSLDPVAHRVVVTCSRSIVVVDIDGRKSSVIPLPAAALKDRISVEVYPEPNAIALHVDLWRPDPVGHWQLQVDPVARTMTSLPDNVERNRRQFDGRPWDWSTDAISSIDGSRWVHVERGILQIADPTGHSLATWGLEDSPPKSIYVDGDGLSATGAHRLRIGPDAQEVHVQPITPETDTRQGCPNRLHVPVATGELWLERQTTSRPAACICGGGVCKDTPHAPFLTALTGRDDALVLATWGTLSPGGLQQVHVTGLDGAERGMISLPKACHEAIARPDKPIAAVLCDDVVIELDLVTGKELRRTPIHGALSNELVAIVDHDIVVQSFDMQHQENYLRVLVAGTGHVRAEVYLWANTAVVRFDDGAIEVFGEAAVSERALRCVTDGVARAWDTCRDQRLVHDRFKLQ